MTRNYTARGLNRAQYLVAGQSVTHKAPYRNPTEVRAGVLPAGLGQLKNLDFMNPANPFFYTDRALHSAGQYIGRKSDLPVGVFTRRPGNTILCDSGGLQYGKTPENWKGDASRDWSLQFLEANADEAITLDIPTRTIKQDSPFDSFGAALATTIANNDYFARHRSGHTRFLSVLQGENEVDAWSWYQGVTAQPFEGWAFGGSMRENYPHVVRIILKLKNEGLLTPERNRLHFLGISSLKNAVMLSALQKALRRELKDDQLQITYDTSSPSKLAAFGKMYGYPQLTSTDFNMSIFIPPSNHAHAAWDTPMPVMSSRISESVGGHELCAPASTRQHGWDDLGNSIAIHHNIDSLLRGIDDANTMMELPSAWTPRLAPRHVVRAYRAVRTMFDYPDPLRHVLSYRSDFDAL